MSTVPKLIKVLRIDTDGITEMTEMDVEGPKPTHFLARGDDKFTPLIPVDELPANVKIAGVRAYINQEELLLLRGNALFPVIEKSAFNYAVDVDNPGASTPMGAKPTGGKRESSSQPSDRAGSPPPHDSHVNVPNTETRDVSVDNKSDRLC